MLSSRPVDKSGRDVARVVDTALETARAMGSTAVLRIRAAYLFKRAAAAGRPGLGADVLPLADRLYEAVCGKEPLADPEARLLAVAALLYFIQPSDVVSDASLRGLTDDAWIIRNVAQRLGLVQTSRVTSALASILAKAKAPASPEKGAPDSEAVSAAPAPPDAEALEATAETFCTPEGREWFLGEVRRSREFAADPDAVLRRLEMSLTSPLEAERHEAACDLRRLARLDYAFLDRARKRWTAIVDHMQASGNRKGLRALREAFCEVDPSSGVAVGEDASPERAAALLAADPLRAAGMYGRLHHASGAAEACRAVLTSRPAADRLVAEADALVAAADVGGVARLRESVERACLEIVLGAAAGRLGPEPFSTGAPPLTPEEAVLAVSGGGRRRDVRRAEAGPAGIGAAHRGSLDRMTRDRDRQRDARDALRPKALRVAAGGLEVRGYGEAAEILWTEAIADEEARRRLRAALDLSISAGRHDLYETYQKAIDFLSGPPGIATPES